MKITFVSNYINHHQIPFCNALAEAEGVEYTFIQMEKMAEERVQMGWNPDDDILSYVCPAYEEPERCRQLVWDSDIVIWGGAEDETWLKPRLDAGKPTFRYSERLYRTGQWKAVSPRGLKKKYHDHTKYRKQQVYLLCAGAYVASDFHIIHAYPGKMLKWGYFPEKKQYDVDKLMAAKGGERTEILWAARFISCKHPELVVKLAERLRQVRKDFHITMIGGGEMETQIHALAEQKNLQDCLSFTGYQTPEEVRAAMEKAEIYVMTSDRQEGWGAVINESMNSGCAVIADQRIGAAPYLIEHGKNGFLYRNGNEKELYDLTVQLLDDGALRRRLGQKAYETINGEWNAETAAKRLLSLCRDLAEGKEPQVLWQSGPCSAAPILKERTWKTHSLV